MCNRYILFALSTAFAIWLALEIPPGLEGYYLSFVCGFVGRWDLAMLYAQKAKEAVQTIDDPGLVGEGAILYTTVLLRIGGVHEMLEEYDEAIDVYVNEVLPRLREELGANDVEIGMVLSDVAEIYRTKGDYQRGLDFLAEAQQVFLGSSEGTRSMLLKLNEESVKEMKRLIDVAEQQEAYVAAVVQAARRWHFATRSQDDTDSEDTCPSMDQCRSKDRFWTPPEFVFFPVIGLSLLIPFRFVWEKPSCVRFSLAFTAAAPILTVLLIYWGWVQESYTGKLNMVGLFQRKLGKSESALKIFDEARCSMLANPYEETLLITDEALDTFLGALFCYKKLGEDDLVDRLAEDIQELIEANSVIEPSFLVMGYYTFLAEHYSQRGEATKSERFLHLAESEAKDLTRALEYLAEEEVKRILEQPAKPLNASLEVAQEEDTTNEKAKDTSIKVGIR